jgi:hypothetical protein
VSISPAYAIFMVAKLPVPATLIFATIILLI